PSVGERRPRVRAPASDRLCESVRSLAARIATLTVAGQVTVRLPGYRIPPPQRKPAPQWRKILYPRRAVRLRSPSSSVESLGRSRDGGYAACARDYLSWPSIDRSPWLGRSPLPPRGTSRRDGRRPEPMSDPPRKETDVARRIRARALARGHSPLEIAQEIHEQCGPLFGTSRIKAHRLAHGVALSDIVAQVKALYEVDGKPPPRLGETRLSAYESGYKRPGPEYLHYLCAVYRVEPDALDYQSPCICGRGHAVRPVAASVPQPREPERRPAQAPATLVGALVPRAEERPWMTVNEPRGPDRGDGPLSTDVGEEDIVLRRTLLQLLAGAGVALDGQFLGAVDNLRRKMDDTLVGATVSPTMLDQWEETTYGYGQQYQATPSLRMLCDVLLDFSEVRRMCDKRQPVELQERLCRIAAQLSGLSGLIMINLGDHR